MFEKLRKALADRCKDMGLTNKAIDRLAELGGEGLTDDSSQDEITKKVDSLVPFAQAMQAEITRKTRKSQTAKKPSNDEGEDESDNQQQEVMPDWAKAFQTQLEELKSENDKLKAEKAQSERSSQIAAKAKELGIPDYLVKRIAIADDADIAKELGDFKQELVTNNLVPKGQAHETGSTLEAMKADAKAWAASLPNL